MSGPEELSNWTGLSIGCGKACDAAFAVPVDRPAISGTITPSRHAKKNPSHRPAIVYNALPTVIGQFGPHRIRRPASRLFHI